MKFPDDQAYKLRFIDDIKDKFYDYLKGDCLAPLASVIPLRSAFIPANLDMSLVAVTAGEHAPRRARITKEDFLKHGYTPGCPGCIATQGGGSRQFRKRTDECRRRTTELPPTHRQKLATDRLDQRTAGQRHNG